MGSLLTGGIEFSGQTINASYLYTKSGENQATLAENTRGKQFVMDEAGVGIYVPDDPTNPGNVAFADSSPYLRQQTSSYTKRTTETVILDGDHELPAGLKLDWTYAQSTAKLSEAKTQFGSKWFGPREFLDFSSAAVMSSFVPPPHRPWGTFSTSTRTSASEAPSTR